MAATSPSDAPPGRRPTPTAASATAVVTRPRQPWSALIRAAPALASAPPLPLVAARPGAAEALSALALRLHPVPGDTQTGPYTRIRVTQWLGHVRIDTGVGTATATSTRWRDELTDSGGIVSTGWRHLTADRPRTRAMSFGAGKLPGVLPGQAPAVSFILAAALDTACLPPVERAITDLRHRVLAAGGRRAADTTCPVRAVGDLVRWHHTPIAVRAATLIALADVDNLLTHGPVTIAGRPAIAVSVTTGPTRQVLGIDTASGEIRFVERVLLDEATGRRLGVQVPYLLERHIITDRGRSTHPHI